MKGNAISYTRLSMEAKRSIRNSIIFPTLTWNAAQESFVKDATVKGMDFGVIELVERDTLSWFGHVGRINGNELLTHSHPDTFDMNRLHKLATLWESKCPLMHVIYYRFTDLCSAKYILCTFVVNVTHIYMLSPLELAMAM